LLRTPELLEQAEWAAKSAAYDALVNQKQGIVFDRQDTGEGCC
jgi:hypothetical protein